jgi:hypothetical protein
MGVLAAVVVVKLRVTPVRASVTALLERVNVTPFSLKTASCAAWYRTLLIAVKVREAASETVALADNVIPVAEFTEVMVVPVGMPVPETAIPATSPVVDAKLSVLTELVEPTVAKAWPDATELSGIGKSPEVPLVLDLSDSTNTFVLL